MTEKTEDMKTTILIVEDDEFFSSVLKNVLITKGFLAELAPNGKVAQNIIALKPFNLVISDIQMPEMDGIAFLKWMKTAHPEIPVILMTGFSSIIETIDAYELGASGFLAKPFEQADLFKAIDQLLSPPEEKIETDQDSSFTRLKIDDFVCGREIPFNVFIRLSKSKYVKIAHKGEDISIEQIRAYKGRDVTHLFLKTDDFAKYLGLNLKITRALKAAKNISDDKKFRLISHTNDILMEKIQTEGLDKETVQTAKEYIESSLDVISSEKSIFDMIENLNQHSEYLYSHGIAVAFISVLLARRLEWNSPRTLHMVTLGGIFHDIGKREIDPGIVMKPRIDRTQEETKSFETHPTRGMEIMSRIGSLPVDVIQIIHQHHETVSGYGYPQRLMKNRIHPAARLVAVADAFCNYHMKTPDGPGFPVEESLRGINTIDKTTLDAQFVSVLNSIFMRKDQE